MSHGLTAVEGLRVGHHTLSGHSTGCTVVLADGGAVGSVDVRGAAPGTRETDLLDPLCTVNRVDAIVLSGGSAFGLDTASGVMRFLEEHGAGFPTGAIPVPIVPAAVIFDLLVGNPRTRPTADSGYQAARAATAESVAEGSVGAGAGATVGKAAGRHRAMKGGVGTAALSTGDGLVVAALMVVNAYGSIVDPASGRVVAGVRTPDGHALVETAELLPLIGRTDFGAGENTTIGIVATNARLSKTQAKQMAQMAHAGLARTVWPVHTPLDGDAIFSLATGRHRPDVDMMVVGSLAAQAVTDAILRAVGTATGISGYPAARDL